MSMPVCFIKSFTENYSILQIHLFRKVSPELKVPDDEASARRSEAAEGPIPRDTRGCALEGASKMFEINKSIRSVQEASAGKPRLGLCFALC